MKMSKRLKCKWVCFKLDFCRHMSDFYQKIGRQKDAWNWALKGIRIVGKETG